MKSEYLSRKAERRANDTQDIDALASDLAEIKAELQKLVESAEAAEGGYKGRMPSSEHLDCSPDTLERLAERGLITKYYLGSKVVFKVAELNRLPTLTPIKITANPAAA
ncbi:hypothetical protein [Labrenzia sp. DG1229]|uniref:hypothetical protein n=1 Tax=Labrenzia sp. DG1229 TaxID=681847 RepID=UPI0004907643|nr:hypothetical protein [Labrenzia sp. DG1229]